ncbi:MAG: acyl-CoA thioesterase [Nitrospiraceae bacterium]|nr:acyl-CoA thioesterase [Nitrospiraceae bacterium]
MEPKPVQGFDVVTRHLVMERDLNPAGNLFGGTMLAWLDEATAVYVTEQIGYTDFVTVAMDDIRFRAPGHRGDIITVYSRIVGTGRTSVTAESKAFVEKPSTNERREMINCTIAYVCLKNQEKYAYFESEGYAEWLGRRGA